jgi:hypothetical protein
MVFSKRTILAAEGKNAAAFFACHARRPFEKNLLKVDVYGVWTGKGN